MGLMNQYLTEIVKTTRGMNAVAAGTSNQSSATVDMQGYNRVRAILAVGALTASQVTKLVAQHGDASNGGDAASLSGIETSAAADADGNKLLILDVAWEPNCKRYCTFLVDRETANAVIDGMIIERYATRTGYISPADTTVSQYKMAVANPA